MIFNMEVGSDEGWGLTSDPSDKRLIAFVCLVILNHLNRAGNGVRVKSLRCRRRGLCRGLSSVALLPRIWSTIARLRSSHLPKSTVLLRWITLHPWLCWCHSGSGGSMQHPGLWRGHMIHLGHRRPLGGHRKPLGGHRRPLGGHRRPLHA